MHLEPLYCILYIPPSEDDSLVRGSGGPSAIYTYLWSVAKSYQLESRKLWKGEFYDLWEIFQRYTNPNIALWYKNLYHSVHQLQKLLHYYSGVHWAAKHDFTDVSVNGLSHDTSDTPLLNFKMSIANGACFKSCETQELSPLL